MLRVLDALTRWYAQPPADDLGLERALDHAARVLRPGARMLVLADPQQAKIGILININREVAAGLMAKPISGL